LLCACEVPELHGCSSLKRLDSTVVTGSRRLLLSFRKAAGQTCFLSVFLSFSFSYLPSLGCMGRYPPMRESPTVFPICQARPLRRPDLISYYIYPPSFRNTVSTVHSCTAYLLSSHVLLFSLFALPVSALHSVNRCFPLYVSLLL